MGLAIGIVAAALAAAAVLAYAKSASALAKDLRESKGQDERTAGVTAFFAVPIAAVLRRFGNGR